MILPVTLLFIMFIRGMSMTMEPPTCNNCCQGPIGPQGASGIPGVPGSHGIPGVMGQKGEAGVGERGYRGDPGVKGEAGRKGEIGQGGPKGDAGIGEQGPPGLAGMKGERGVPGPAAVTRRSAFTVIKNVSSQDGSPNDVVSFQRVVTDIGHDFDTSTGKFTCRVPGVYFFMFNFNIDQASLDHRFGLVKNDELLVEAYGDSLTQNADRHVGNGAVVNLEAGDQVWIKFVTNTGEVDGESRTCSFTGYLMYEN